MPRRAQPAVVIAKSASPQPDDAAQNLATLRTQWRWAAFSQFFFTFYPLFAMSDVSIADIEGDLTHGTKLVLPRIMQRLLYTLSYDRKVSVVNWQTALRKQYNKRDPLANPIGPEPQSDILEKEEEDNEKELGDGVLEQHDETTQNEDGANGDNPDLSASRAMSISATPLPSESSSQRDLNSTRQSSLAGDKHALSLVNDVDHNTSQQISMDWFDLSMLAKLESIHTLAEWQFQNTTRLRMIMKSDDELALWRIEPIGYDSKRNAYWFIGNDRLWIQRVPPKAPRTKTLKRKRPSQKLPEKSKASRKTTKRPRLGVAETPSTTRKSMITSPTTSGRPTRGAKDQAKMKLDAQAKELAELNRQATSGNSKTRSSRQTTLRSQTISTPSRGLGTRVSARLRGPVEDEWQPIPDEWLNNGSSSRTGSKRRASVKTGLESDQESFSDLTELSDDTSDAERESVSNGRESSKNEDEEEAEPEPESQAFPDNFVEWETICATLYDWDHIGERFEKATHYSEKALYKVLINDIVPAVANELREIERKRQLEEALVHRKRSSRIAVKENEKEEARMAAQKRQEENEKMSRARRMEVRQQKEEEQRLKQEFAREQRRKEREAREDARKVQVADQEPEKIQVEEVPQRLKSPSPVREARQPKARKSNGKNGTSSGSRTPAGEDWELACEICHRQGINLDDGTPMMSCGVCSRWQHIQCHDRADRAAGRPRRNWNSVDFICSRCRANQRVQYNNYHPPLAKPLPPMNVPQVQPYGSYQPIVPMHSGIGYPQDNRSPGGQYIPGYRDPAHQSYYVRPVNGHQYPNAPPQYPQPTSTHSTLSFSHYQPAERGFSSKNQQSYPTSHQSYGHVSNPPQQYSSEHPLPYKPQTQTAAWNVSTPAQAPGYPMPQNPHLAAVASSSSYRHTPPDNRDGHPIPTYPNHEPSQTSYTRYPTDPHYPAAQFKHHHASYQPSLG